MYAIINKSNNQIEGYNKRYDVCIKYIDNSMNTYGNTDLIIVKIKNKKAKNDPDFDDLYLVRYQDTYIQSGYIEYLSLNDNQTMYDNMYALDVLLRFLDTDQSLTKKERKHIECVVSFLFNVLKEDKRYTPSLKDLKGLEEYYSSYINGVYE